MLGMVLFIAACVTINVYFPSAAAEQAADRIIRDVYGEESNSASPAEAPAPESSLQPPGSDAPLTITLLNLLAPPVQAAANINIQSPAITALRASMKSRFTKLKSFYENGGVGMTQGGLIKVRDLNAISLRDRKTVTTLVADENRDRDKLYLEIARANGHPEWETDIRKTFASRWIENAPAGWWYQDAAGQWKQK
jgi:uncharacterized protein YdbL (DUF1318 family)